MYQSFCYFYIILRIGILIYQDLYVLWLLMPVSDFHWRKTCKLISFCLSTYLLIIYYFKSMQRCIDSTNPAISMCWMVSKANFIPYYIFLFIHLEAIALNFFSRCFGTFMLTETYSTVDVSSLINNLSSCSVLW